MTVFKANAQEIKTITMTAFGETEIAAKSESEAKRKLKKLNTYPEYFDLYFDSKSTSTFDRHGKIISQTDFKENGEIYRKTDYEYTNSGNIQTERFYNPLSPKSNRLVTYKYNANNDLTQIVDSSNNLTKQTDILFPSENNRLSTLKINGEYVNKWITQSDTSENFELTTAYDNNDSVFTVVKRWYNADKKSLKQINLDANQNPTLTWTFKYDLEGNKNFEREESYYDSRIVERYWITDSINNTKEFKSLTNGKLDHFSRSYYDKNGSKIKTEFYDSENTDTISFTTTSEYKYDTNDNWIERKDFWKGKVQSVTYRQIEYYE